MQLTFNKIVKKIKRKLKLDHLYNQKIISFFTGKSGIEIGGPSGIFSTGLPIYSVIENLDGCNFSTNTVWEGSIKEGAHYHFGLDKTGFQYISEASDLSKIPSNKYDFILASHCLEHCANALKTVEEWMRIIKPGGIILLILPDKRYTFDHKREITTIEHLQDDLANGIDEKDLTHLDEIMALHDLSLDLAAGDKENFKNRSLSNFENRCLHHHVFDFDLLTKIFEALNVELLRKTFQDPYHQIIIGKKR